MRGKLSDSEATSMSKIKFLFKVILTPPILALSLYLTPSTGTELMADDRKPHRTGLEMLAPGTYIPDLAQRRLAEPYVLQRLSDRTYLVAVGSSNSVFYVGDKGVLVFDPLAMGWGHGVLKAIASVTDLPVTGLVYSHFHMDHIGDAQIFMDAFPEEAGAMRIFASLPVADQVKLYGTPVPMPTDVIQEQQGSFKFEDLSVRSWLTKDGHSKDNTMFLLEQEKVLIYADIVDPGYLIPYFGLGAIGSEVPSVERILRRILELDWQFLNAGHDNVGSKKDVEKHLEMIADIRAATQQAVAAEPLGKYINPAQSDALVWIANQQSAIERHAMDLLRPKYGNLSRFDTMMGSHIRIMITDLPLWGEQ